MSGTPGRPPWHPEYVAARRPFLHRRGLLAAGTRAFFNARGYTEAETPYAVATPGEEVHLRAFRTEHEFPDRQTETLWLHTSPEFAMKKLLAGGAGPIFNSHGCGGMGKAATCMHPSSPCSSGIDLAQIYPR